MTKKNKNDENALARGSAFAHNIQRGFAPAVSNGMTIESSYSQQYLSEGAPLTSFGNEVIDDLLRDNFAVLYYTQANFKNVPPFDREINRRLLDYVLADPQWDAYHLFLANRRVAAAAAAYQITEKLMEIKEAAEALSEMAQAEMAQAEADELNDYADNGGNPPPSAYGDDDEEQDGGGGSGDDDDGDDDEEQDGDGDGDSDGEGGGSPMSREEAKQEAQNKQAQADAHRQRAEHGMRNFEDNFYNEVLRSAAVKAGGELGEEISAFMLQWGMDEGDGYMLSIDEIRFIMQMMGDAKISTLTSLMGRFYNIAAHALAGRAPVLIYNQGAGLTQNVPNLFPEQLARLNPANHPAIFQKALEEFIIDGLAGIMQVSEAKREGKFIFGKDGSGSMLSPVDGVDEQGHTTTRDVLASAILLGLANAAKMNGQPFSGFNFGCGTELSNVITEKSGIFDLVQYARQNYGGGTDFSPAMNYALDILDASDELDKAGTDILFITDGQASIDDETTERFYEAREKYGVRLWVLLLSRFSSRSLEGIADKVLDFGSFDEMGETLANLIFMD